VGRSPIGVQDVMDVFRRPPNEPAPHDPTQPDSDSEPAMTAWSLTGGSKRGDK